MAANRGTPTPVNTPGGIAGGDYATDVYDEIRAIWAILGGMLSSVTGTNSLTATATPTLDAYTHGQTFTLIPPNTNSGAMQINIDNRGNRFITDAFGNDVIAGTAVANKIMSIRYDANIGKFRIESNTAVVSTALGRMLLVREVASTNDGGTTTSGSEQTYPWDREVVNTIAGASSSLGTEQFTLPAGVYYGDFALCFFITGKTKVRLFNVTDGVYMDDCISINSQFTTGNQTGQIQGKIALTLTATKTFKFVYKVQTSNTGDGLGVNISGLYTMVEQYGYVDIQQTTSATGATGASIRTGSGVPSSGLGNNGDLYINYANSNLYEKVAGTWTLRGNIKGGTGAGGSAGASLLTGSGVPSNALGNNGDSYIDAASSTGDLYFKSGGVWSNTGYDMKGPRGQDGVLSDDINFIKRISQAAYDALVLAGTVEPTTLYLVY